MRQDTLFGIETEYALSAWPSVRGARPIDRQRLLGEMLDLARSRLVHLPDRGSPGCFLGNGCRFYVDAGGHPELCTPECLTPEQLVRWLLAGEQILDGLVGELRKSHPSQEIVIYKSNVDYSGSGSTWGCHESYAVTGNQTALAAPIMSHLVSRIVFSGAGGFDNRRADRPFLLSPRVPHLQSTAAWSPDSARALIHSRCEPLARSGHDRLHLMCGESLCSQLASYLKVGSTALVVRLAELGESCGDGLALADPLDAMRCIASDPTCRVRVRLADGRRLTAVEIQRRYLENVEARLGHAYLPEWTAGFCTRWRDILDRLAEGPEAVACSLDWAIKYALFRDRGLMAVPPAGPGECGGDAEREGAAPGPSDRLAEIDTRYGQIGAAGLFTALDGSGALDHRLPGLGAVDEAMLEPPPGGRAEARGRTIRRLAGQGSYSCSWDFIHDDQTGRRILLNDPYAAEAPDWGLASARASRVRPSASERSHPPTFSRASGLDAGIAHYQGLRMGEAVAVLRQEVASHEDGSDEQSLARAWCACSLQDLGLVDQALGVLEPALEWTRQAGGAGALAQVQSRQVLLLLERPAPLAYIEEQLEVAEELVRARDPHLGRSRFLQLRGRLQAARGRMSEAISSFERALAEAPQDPVSYAQSAYLRWLMRAQLRDGQLGPARAVVEEWRPYLASGREPERGRYLGIEESRLLMAEGMPGRAFEIGRSLLGRPLDGPVHRYRIGAGCVFVEAAVAAGRSDEARPVVAELLGLRQLQIAELRYEISRAHLAYADSVREPEDASEPQLRLLDQVPAARATAAQALKRSARHLDFRLETDCWMRGADAFIEQLETSRRGRSERRGRRSRSVRLQRPGSRRSGS